jgi:hypothetical protein
MASLMRSGSPRCQAREVPYTVAPTLLPCMKISTASLPNSSQPKAVSPRLPECHSCASHRPTIRQGGTALMNIVQISLGFLLTPSLTSWPQSTGTRMPLPLPCIPSTAQRSPSFSQSQGKNPLQNGRNVLFEPSFVNKCRVSKLS